MESTFSSSLGIPCTAKHFALETANVIKTIESISKPTVTPYPLQKQPIMHLLKALECHRKLQTIPPVRRRKEEREPGRSVQRYRETFDLTRIEVIKNSCQPLHSHRTSLSARNPKVSTTRIPTASDPTRTRLTSESFYNKSWAHKKTSCMEPSKEYLKHQSPFQHTRQMAKKCLRDVWYQGPHTRFPCLPSLCNGPCLRHSSPVLDQPFRDFHRSTDKEKVVGQRRQQKIAALTSYVSRRRHGKGTDQVLIGFRNEDILVNSSKLQISWKTGQ